MPAETAVRKSVYSNVEQVLGQVPSWLKQLPETALKPYWEMFRDFYFGQTLIPNKYKELIGLAVSGATRCRYCALFHTEAAKLAGATDEEIAEASQMGAFTMQSSTFINAQQIDYEQFKKECTEIVAFVRGQMGKGPQPQPPRERVAHA